MDNKTAHGYNMSEEDALNFLRQATVNDRASDFHLVQDTSFDGFQGNMLTPVQGQTAPGAFTANYPADGDWLMTEPTNFMMGFDPSQPFDEFSLDMDTSDTNCLGTMPDMQGLTPCMPDTTNGISQQPDPSAAMFGMPGLPQDPMDLSMQGSLDSEDTASSFPQNSIQSFEPITPSAMFSSTPETPFLAHVKNESPLVSSPGNNNIGESDESLRVEMPRRSSMSDDPFKKHYFSRIEGYSSAKVHRSSKTSAPKPHQVDASVPWRNEVLPDTARKTKTFKGYVKNYGQARLVDEAWRSSHVQGGPCKTTNPSTDSTFPDLTAVEADPQYLKLCSQIFYALCDWGRISEWTQVVTAQQREELLNEIHADRVASGKHGSRGMTADQLRPSDEKLAGLIPDTDEQHMRLMGIPFPEDYVLEQMATDLLEPYSTLQDRVDAIVETLRTSKQVYKSLRSSSLSWVHRIASQPMHEVKSKRNNTVVNFAKNRRAKWATEITQKDWEVKGEKGEGEEQ
ncbi:hypothetical protein LIA77_11866 [Sarocladium implicatum]|nr:hypothetical protein LIA77_11866 [Sarocladium implicatum]